ncbi:MAG TPA: cation transporter [Solibacterales bacterium]|nr:cation transporter [Bryobacterales bacterium]
MHAHHHHRGASTGQVLRWSLLATALFVGIEIFYGFRAHSLALLSDAGHNATDALALMLAWFGVYVQNKPADEHKTFGYQRAGVLAAFVNALTLWAVSVWIIWEAYRRFWRPEAVNTGTMMLVALGGIVLNGGIMLGLSRDRHADVNIRSAFVHMLGDLLGSIAIVAGAAIIRFTGWHQVDPLLSVLISALVVWTAWDIIHEALNILLEGLPRGLAYSAVQDAMRTVAGVLDVHDLHVWSLGSSSHALSCHVLIEDLPLSVSDRILQELNHLLSDRFKIHHTTVQFEHVSCGVTGTGCVIPVTTEHAHHEHP